MSTAEITKEEPVLRTLSPALRSLQRGLRGWLNAEHIYPRSTILQATLEGLANDLHRQSESLDMDRPLLTIMLMGGTGVGKSTLLNALAGGAIAQASFARPTTRDPVVYYHESIQPARLDPALRHCRLAQHDRPELQQKIIVDTPDLDSNDLANREKLHRLLPVADIVLYVGSQEKYHDQLGWELFLQHRQRRAFAFVLNKWDRCAQAGASGVRPDEDLLSDLQKEGFAEPRLFRTCAQYWVEREAQSAERGAQSAERGAQSAERGAQSAEREERDGTATGAPRSALRAPLPPALRAPHAPPEGEQFQELVQWLELGLTRLEIEAIKARGVSQLLHQLQKTLREASPPDLTDVAEKTHRAWSLQLTEEARGDADVLLNTLEPYQREIEHHFAQQRQSKFRGLMAGYLALVNKMKYAGSTLRDRIPFVPRITASAEPAPPTWDLAAFTRTCSTTASERHLDSRGRALINRLLVEADKLGFPVGLLNDPTEKTSKLDWRQRYADALVEALSHVEQEWSKPTGLRRWIQGGVVFLANWLPSIAFFAALAVVLMRFFGVWGEPDVSLFHMFLPPVILLAVLVLLHLVIAMVLPLRWLAIRDEFLRQLTRRLQSELDEVYGEIPGQVAQKLLAERRQLEQYLRETDEVTNWLEQREHAASITGLYGR